jgi:uncharacterized protein Yka (UPF0111/DUF47 family)
MIAQAIVYFRSRTERERNELKRIIRDVHQAEKEADYIEHALKKKAFTVVDVPVDLFHIVRVAEIIGGIADDAQNTADRMRIMIAR